jgi:hypothetical protein
LKSLPTFLALKISNLRIGGVAMIMRYADPFDSLFAFQQALENRLASGWLEGSTAGVGSYPPINIFQQGDNLVAIVELSGVTSGNRSSRTLTA